MARPRTPDTVTIELAISEKLVAYLDELKTMDGFGNSRPEIIRNFVWKEINRLIEVGRLAERQS